jgi:hypothetical protein
MSHNGALEVIRQLRKEIEESKKKESEASAKETGKKPGEAKS